MSSSSSFLAFACIAALFFLCAPTTPVSADSCFAACCSTANVTAYGYGNYSKRGANVGGTSDCNCATEVAYQCKSDGAAMERFEDEVLGLNAPARPEDHCFGACCFQGSPFNFYGYGDYFPTISAQGQLCHCYYQTQYACARE